MTFKTYWFDISTDIQISVNQNGELLFSDGEEVIYYRITNDNTESLAIDILTKLGWTFTKIGTQYRAMGPER